MPRYLIDVNLPRKLSLWHSSDFEFVADLDPALSDQKIWDYASASGLTIVTKDADFTARGFCQFWRTPRHSLARRKYENRSAA